MNSQQIEELLRDTATSVKNLLLNKTYQKKFDQYRQAFHEKQIAYEESERLWYRQVNKYRKRAASDERLRNKEGGPPQKGYVWYDDSPCETGDPNLGFWGPPCKNPVLSPELLLMPVADANSGRLPNDETEELEKHYILLLIIYDWILPGCHLTNENTLAYLARVIDFYDTDNKQGLIEIALNNVRANLKQAPPNDKADVVDPPKDNSCEHNDDYTWVKWFGTEYTFNRRQQSKAVKSLWGAFRKGIGLHQDQIAKEVGTVSNNYRLLDTFRVHGKEHSAWDSMIKYMGNGVYALTKPNPETK